MKPGGFQEVATIVATLYKNCAHNGCYTVLTMYTQCTHNVLTMVATKGEREEGSLLGRGGLGQST